MLDKTSRVIVLVLSKLKDIHRSRDAVVVLVSLLVDWAGVE